MSRPIRAGIDRVEQTGRHGPAEADQRALKLGQLERALANPRDDLAQRLIRCAFETGELDVRIAVVDLDLVGPGVIGRGHDGAGEWLLTELGVDDHGLSGRHAGADRNGELGEGGGAVGHTSLRLSGHGPVYSLGPGGRTRRGQGPVAAGSRGPSGSRLSWRSMAGTELGMPSGEAPPAGAAAGASVAGRVVAGGVQRIAAFGVINLITAAAAVLLLRYLGVRDFGRYGTVMALMAIVQGVTDGGLTLTGARELSLRSDQADRDDLLGNLIGLRIMFTGVGVLAAVVFAAAVGYDSTLVEGTALVGVSVFLLSIQSAALLPLTVDLENSRLAVNDILRQLVLVIAFVVLAVAGTTLLPFFAASPAAAVVVFACTPILLNGRRFARPRWRAPALRSLAVKTLPLALFGVLSVIYFRILVILMSLLQSSALQLGYYVTSARVMETCLGIPVVLIGVVLPVLSVSARDDVGRLQYVTMRLTQSMAWLGLLLAVVLGTGARSILLLFGGSQYVGAAPILQIQCLALITIFITAAWTTALVGMGRTRDLAIATLVGLAAVTIVGSVLISVDGAEGAAIAAVVADVLYCATAGFFVRRGSATQAIAAGPMVRLAASAIPALVLATVPILPNAISCVVGTALFVGLSIMSGAVPPEIIDHTPLRRLRRA